MEHSRTFLLITLALCACATVYAQEEKSWNGTKGISAKMNLNDGCLTVMRYVESDDVTNSSSTPKVSLTDPTKLCLSSIYKIANGTKGEEEACTNGNFIAKDGCGVYSCKSGMEMMEVKTCFKDMSENKTFAHVTVKAPNWCSKANMTNCTTSSKLGINFKVILMTDLEIKKMDGYVNVTYDNMSKKTYALHTGKEDQMVYIFKKYGDGELTGDLMMDYMSNTDKKYEAHVVLKLTLLNENSTHLMAYLGVQPGYKAAKARNTTGGCGVLVGSVLNVALVFVLSFFLL